MNRRDFVRSVTLAGAALAAPTAIAQRATHEKKAALPRVIKPPRLEPGDTVGIVLPATAEFETNELEIGVEQIRALGFEDRKSVV